MRSSSTKYSYCNDVSLCIKRDKSLCICGHQVGIITGIGISSYRRFKYDRVYGGTIIKDFKKVRPRLFLGFDVDNKEFSMLIKHAERSHPIIFKFTNRPLSVTVSSSLIKIKSNDKLSNDRL